MPPFPTDAIVPVIRTGRPTLTVIALGAGLASGGALAQSFPAYNLQPLPLTAFTAFNAQGQILGRAIPPCPLGQICSTSDTPALVDTARGTVTVVSSDYGALNGNGQLAGASNLRDASGNIVRSVLVRQPDGRVSSGSPPAIAPTLPYPLRARGLTNSGSIAVQLSLVFLTKPHTAQEPGTVAVCGAAPGSVADCPLWCAGPGARLPVVKTGSGHDQSHILVSLLPVGEICLPVT